MAADNDTTGPETTFTPSPWLDTPERILAVLIEGKEGLPIDALSCVLLRAHAVTMLLTNEFEDAETNRLTDDVLLNALWDIQGNLEMAQALLNARRNQNAA